MLFRSAGPRAVDVPALPWGQARAAAIAAGGADRERLELLQALHQLGEALVLGGPLGVARLLATARNSDGRAADVVSPLKPPPPQGVAGCAGLP